MTAAVIRIRGSGDNDECGYCRHCGRDNRGYESEPCSDDCPQYDDVEAARLRWVEACRVRDEATERAREALAEWSRLEREANDAE